MNEQSLPLSPEIIRKRRLRMILVLAGILATVVVPTLIGDLAYRFGWYKGWQTNLGQPVEPHVSIEDFHARDSAGKALRADFARKKWWLLYVMPSRCEDACRNRLFQMRQVRKALGKEAERMSQLLVFTGPASSATEALLKEEFPGFLRVEADAANVDIALQRAAAQASGAGQLYVMDPMGWIMLAYAPVADEKASVVKAEEILQDLRKLLKGSRIG